MKGVDIFCTSQAATATCLSLESHSTSSPSPSTFLLPTTAAIDRHNPIIGDSKRIHPPKPPKKNKIKTPANENQQKTDLSSTTTNTTKTNDVRKSWSCTNPGDFLSPPASTSFFLREKVLHHNPIFQDAKTEDPTSSPPAHQVVDLRVSLHCRGCERKLRKHLSKMEGVTTFNIDFTAKKVTVAGNVTPLGVLTSISKVKNAQLWSPQISSPSKGAAD